MYTVEEFDKQKTRILKYILYKRRTEQEVRDKFSKEVEEFLLDDIIEYLKETNYINDLDYIERAVNNFFVLKNLSIKEIKYKLQAKGLQKKLIENYIEKNMDEFQVYEIKSAQNIFNKKSTTKETEEIKQYLLKKGYKFESIEKAIENNIN